MEPRIWSSLPEELLEKILSFLPFKMILNLRSTCKFFNSLISSPNFIYKYSSSSPLFSSFLLLSHPQCHHHLALYDSVVGTWRNNSVSPSLLLPSAAPSAILSSSNGLVCLSVPSSSSLLVCNLLTNSTRSIEFPTYPFQFELLTLISTPGGYTIFILCSWSSSTDVFLYDSKFLSWRRFDGSQPILSDNFHQKGAFFHGCLYFTTPEPCSIVCFDLETGKWDRPNGELPDQLIFARLVSDGDGKLYMIGGVGTNGISRSMILWEMGEAGNWVKLDSLPEFMCRKFGSVCYHNYEHVYCFWHQGMICICCYTWPEILYYKFSRRTWHWLPKCPSLPEKWSCGFRWFSFVPELSALV
ncbi:F-box/kelch-repeat protein [Quillaja saponaria]|uniref:F-box/kelch-repeat protein n=1 Tax=Quillaja saponaria TaxID=32244 RepID=A0AAD7LHH9_QUISA|nr:F-box/kelch-repeat protein [Quillaja saponaria]